MSQYWSILQAAQSALASLAAFSAATPAIVPAVRRRPFHSQAHGDPLPFVCVSYTFERFGGLTFNDSWIDYEVNVTIFQDKGAALMDSAAQQWQLDRREEIRKLLFRGNPFITPASVFDCVGYDPSPVYDVGGLDEGLGVSRQSFVFRNTESRG